MEKRTLDQAKELVNSSFPTIFSKEDVMNLLGSIEIPEAEEETPKGKFFLSKEQIESLAEKIACRMEDDEDDIIDSDDVDFDIDVDYDRRINIEITGGLTLNLSSIENIAHSVIEQFIDELELNEEED
jgi:hypothetical protein